MNFHSNVQEAPYIGPQYQKKLNKLGIKTIGDLLFHLPSRYEDFSKISFIKDLKLNEVCCIKGRIIKIENIYTRKKRFSLTEAVVSDQTGTIALLWYNQSYLKTIIKEGEYFCFAGRFILTDRGSYLVNPAYEKIRGMEIESFDKKLMHTGRIVPIYPETRGISSRWLRFVIKIILERLERIDDPIPQEVLKKYKLLALEKSIWEVHFPLSFGSQKKAKERFSFQELFLLGLFVLSQRIKRIKAKSYPLEIKLKTIQGLIKSLPFGLTNAQKKSLWQILKDMEKPRPMFRLLQGDVGSGKTIVGAIASLNVVKSGGQVAFMAPTEILAKQHFETVHNFLKNSDLDIGLITSKNDKFFSKKLKNQVVEISKRKIVEKTKDGKIDILIGTHSLIQEKVRFKNLLLIVVDEQHRFGVEQRASLYKRNRADKNPLPHFLSMTATPIPRTLALTVYGDLDISILDEMPKGQRMVNTIVVSANKRNDAYEIIRNEIKKGRQAFIICPRIEKKEDEFGQEVNDFKAVKEEYLKLSKKIFKEFNIGMLHGKMGSKEKERTMKNFGQKKIDILVSTSVVEVGIDMPNATVMLVEGAERFGLAQLHQFRGRIGRAGDESYFLLLPQTRSKSAYRRLTAIAKTNDGLKLAEEDLKIRGPGDFVGKRQWGIPNLLMSSLLDIALIEKTREAAKEILEKGYNLTNYPLLKKELARFKEIAHLE